MVTYLAKTWKRGETPHRGGIGARRRRSLARGVIQDRMLAELSESINRVEDIDWNKADRLIRRDLTPLEFPQ